MLEIIHIKTFKTPENHEIRVITSWGAHWFVAKDVAQALGFKNTHDAIRDHVSEDCRETAMLPQPGGGSRRHTVLDIRGVFQLTRTSYYTRRVAQCQWFPGWFTKDVLLELQDDFTWLRGLQAGIQALMCDLANKYDTKYLALASKATVRATEAENRLKAIAEIVQGDRS